MDEIQLNDDDVVLIENADASFINTRLFKIGWFKAGSNRLSPYMNNWMNKGFDCEILQAHGGGWRKGKLRLRLEFVPDEPDAPQSSDIVLSPKTEQ
jgi:hypothetical protein